jgi:hypothetical protein
MMVIIVGPMIDPVAYCCFAAADPGDDRDHDRAVRLTTYFNRFGARY